STHTYTLSLHDALPICSSSLEIGRQLPVRTKGFLVAHLLFGGAVPRDAGSRSLAHHSTRYILHRTPHTYSRRMSSGARTRTYSRSEEHTSELQSRSDLV